MMRSWSILALGAGLVLGACSSSGGGTAGNEDIATVISHWPDRLDSLDLAKKSDTYVADVRKAVPSATDVQVRSLTHDGGLLLQTTGAADLHSVPDVVFLAGGDVARMSTDTLRRTVLRAVLDELGVGALADPHYDFVLNSRPFTGTHGLHGGYIPPPQARRLAGFVASSPAAKPDGTWCAFVAHGVAVVVLGWTLSRAQDEQLAATLRG